MFLRKHWVPLSVFGVVAICALVFFLLRSDVPQEPIKIYKTTTPAPRVSKLAKTAPARVQQEVSDRQPPSESDRDAELTDTAAGGHFHADGTWHAEPHTQPQPHTSTRPVPDADAAEDEVSEWVVVELEVLASQMEAKYPEIAQLAELTPAEIKERYSTPEAREALRTLASEARAEFFDDLRALFSLLPVDVVETALEETRQDFTEIFGDEMAGTVISYIRTEMGL